MAKKKKETPTTEQPEAEASSSKEPAVDEVQEISLEEQLNIELLQAREDAKNHQDQYLRALAEMDNLRKRTQREKEDLGKYANENILRDILPVLDNLERAVEHAEQDEGSSALLEGVQMTQAQFSQVLERFGVEPVKALGQPFDPAVHQAMGQLETSDYVANTVAQEMQRGYLLNGRLLRPSMVMVAKEPEDKEPAAEDRSAAESQNK